MSSTEATTSAAPVKVAKKKTATSKPKKVADHPKYAEMIKDALTNLKVYCSTLKIEYYKMRCLTLHITVVVHVIGAV